MDDVEGKVIGPIPSQDMQAAQTVVTFNVGANGWNKMPAIGDKIHEIATLDGRHGLPRRQRRSGHRLRGVLRRPRQHACCSRHCSR